MKGYSSLSLKTEKKTMFGNIGLPELMIILAVALLVFGPKKLPEVGRSIGKALREFRKTTDEIKGKFEEQIRVDDIKDIHNDIKKSMSEDEEGPKVS
jgi:TatA/E family protein of Tat protein translocase